MFFFFCLLTRKCFHVSRYVGRLFVKSSGKPIEILEKINKMAGFTPDEEIELYEVCVSTNIFCCLLVFSLFCALLLIMLFELKSLMHFICCYGLGNKV